MDGFRRTRRLYSAEGTYRWMADRGITREKLEKCVGDEALVAKLREREAAGGVEEYFAAHRSDFDRACLAQIVFPDAEDAQSAYERIRRGDFSIYDVARDRALASLERSEQRPVETFAVLRRGEAPAAMTAVFEAAAGDLLPLIRTEDGFILAQVIAVVPASLNSATRQEVMQVLFREWLEARRREATIEWNWGNAQRTAGVVGSKLPLATIDGGNR
jgi:putative peptide maturation system protein